MKRNWQPEELIELFTLVTPDIKLIGSKTTTNKIGFTVLLKFFQIEARFPSLKAEIPQIIIDFIAKQIETHPELFKNYDLSDRTCRKHRQQIREYFKFREPPLQDSDDIADCVANKKECINNETVKDFILRRVRGTKVGWHATFGTLLR